MFDNCSNSFTEPRDLQKVLTIEKIGRLVCCVAEQGTWQEKARDFFLFNYSGNGINMKDILLLKWGNIDGEYIRYVRAKTKRTNKTCTVPITLYVNEEMRNIILRWGNPQSSAQDYLFPVLKEGLTPEREMAIIQQFIKMINKYLKLIAQELSIDKPITTYFARHSFATILKKSGVSPLFISESLGHASVRTTEIYLDSFEDDQRKSILENLRKYQAAS